MEKVELIESLKVLEVQDGDVIVVKVKEIIGDSHVAHIAEIVDELFKGRNIKTLVLDDGMDIGVLRAQPLVDSNEN